MSSSGEYIGQRRLRFAAASVGAFAFLIWATPSLGATATPSLPVVSASLAPVVAEVVATVPANATPTESAPTDALTTTVTTTVTTATTTVAETVVDTLDSTVAPVVTTAKTVVDTTIATVDSTLVAPVVTTAENVVAPTTKASGTTPRAPAGTSVQQRHTAPSGDSAGPTLAKVAANVASAEVGASSHDPIASGASPTRAKTPALVPAKRALLPDASSRSALLSKPTVATRDWSRASPLPTFRGERESSDAAGAARPGNLTPANMFGSGVPRSATPTLGAPGTGAGGAALILFACLALFLWAAPPLRRWLRRQHGSWLLPVPVAPLERPG